MPGPETTRKITPNDCCSVACRLGVSVAFLYSGLPMAPNSTNLSLVPVSNTRCALAVLAIFFAGVSATAQTADLPDAPGAAPATVHAGPMPTGPTVVIDTSMGRITCKTFDKEAPNTVANFVGLAEGTKEWTSANGAVKHRGKPFYDGLTFHRVIPGFMVQAGDPVGDGTGDAGYFLDDEIVPELNFDVPGRLAMANSGPNTNSSQFFITEAAQPDLNGHYTIFGQCDPHSVLIVASIARVERDANDKPLTPVTISHVTIVRDGQQIPALPASSSTQPAAQDPPASSTPDPARH